jgi:hypothetical protein
MTPPRVTRAYQASPGAELPAAARAERSVEYALARYVFFAKDEKARAFYERFDFEPSPTDPLHLMLLIKDARRTVEAGEDS